MHAVLRLIVLIFVSCVCSPSPSECVKVWLGLSRRGNLHSYEHSEYCMQPLLRTKVMSVHQQYADSLAVALAWDVEL